MKLYFVILLLMFSPPTKNKVLKTFCEGWLKTSPIYRLPLDEFTVGIYYNERFSMRKKQKTWQQRKKHQLSGIPGDFNGDGFCNLRDFAIFANVWKHR